MKVGLRMNLRLLIILLIHFNRSYAFRSKPTNMVCESFNKSWVVYKECRIRPVSRNKTTLTAIVDLLEPAYDIIVRSQILRKANGYKPWIIDYTVDACQFMRNKRHPFGRIIFNLLRGVSSINHTCPYVGLNGFRDFYNIDSLPIMFPTDSYLLNITIMFDKKPQLVLRIYFNFSDDL